MKILSNEVLDTLLSLDSKLELKASKFENGDAIFLYRKEVFHFHGKEEVDVRLGNKLIKKCGIFNKLKKNNTVNIRKDWVSFSLNKKGDADLLVSFIKDLLDINQIKGHPVR